jgi:hypothetical protein
MNPTSAATMLLTWWKGQGCGDPDDRQHRSEPVPRRCRSGPGLASATTVPSNVAPARAKPIAAAGRPPNPWADGSDKRLDGRQSSTTLPTRTPANNPTPTWPGGRREPEPDRLTRAAMLAACVVIGRPTMEECIDRAPGSCVRWGQPGVGPMWSRMPASIPSAVTKQRPVRQMRRTRVRAAEITLLWRARLGNARITSRPRLAWRRVRRGVDGSRATQYRHARPAGCWQAQVHLFMRPPPDGLGGGST